MISIDLASLIPKIVTVDFLLDRAALVAKGLESHGLQRPMLYCGDKCDPYWKGNKKSHLGVLAAAELPLLVLEDDATIIPENFRRVIQAPAEADVLYLGGTLNAEKYPDNKVVAPRQHAPRGRTKNRLVYRVVNEDWARVFNMHSAHAILFVTARGLAGFTDAAAFHGGPIDVCYARAMRYLGVYMLRRPIFYQQDGRNDDVTRIML